MKNGKNDFLTACCSVIAISLALLGPLNTQAGRGSRTEGDC